ncbi:MFS transporter [Caldifermentibacillus hisashii]|uniref:MFS transporter n=1 Tax=Caldifermentibacillus hisashii TaxID=996558 RepID=UPI002DFF7E07|nr:MFS transporter [Caldifermentibacillus hisashii]
MAEVVKQDNSIQNTNNVKEEKIGLTEKVGFGLGDLATNFVWGAMGTYIVYFYTDVIGVAAGIIGTIMLFSRLFDGVTDVIMGALVDKVNSKHGKARAWILWLAIPFAIATVLLFTVPDVGPVGTIIYIIITYNLISLIYTGINIPYGVLNALMTQHQYQRSVLNIFRMVSGQTGGLIVGVLTIPMVAFFGGGQNGWVFAFVVYAVVAAILFGITFKTTTERVKPVKKTKSTIPFKTSIVTLFKNKYWFIMLLFFILTFIYLAISQGSTVYFAQFILGDVNLVSVLLMANTLPIILGMLFYLAPVVKRFGKRNAAIAGSFISIVGGLLILINPSSTAIVVTALILRGIGQAAIVGTIFALLADTIEYGEWKTGIRNEGMIYAGGSMGLKIGTGVGSALIGWLLASGGYVGGQETQAGSALFSIEVLFIYLPIVINILQLVLMYLYKLDKEYEGIVEDLQARASQ